MSICTKVSLSISIIILCLLASCQENKRPESINNSPKLVVGIVVDQMRPDYISRFSEHFGAGGFNRLIKHGFYNRNVHYNYIPTYTGPGHASVYTGAIPATHGIIANSWYDKKSGKYVYCAGDSTMASVGTDSKSGQMSPHRLLSTTITDELMLATNFKSKIIGISLKDRGSVLPAGHTPTGAYWFDDKTGHFVTSEYYTSELSQWMKAFNNKNLAQEYLNSKWALSMPIDEYKASTQDDMPYEYTMDTIRGAVFPYDLSNFWDPSEGYGLVKSTPYGNKILTQLAKAAIAAEEMGDDEITDFLALSYSSPDYIGHGFGPRSVELEDMYIKFDKEIEELLVYLDEEIGEGNYTVFLTADHAAAEVPQYMINNKIPAGYYNRMALRKMVSDALTNRFGKGDWIESFSNEQFFLNHQLIKEKGLALAEMTDVVREAALAYKGVAEAYSAFSMRENYYQDGMKMKLQNGYNFQRSGDVLLTLEPGWFAKGGVATSHGSGYNYDTHVPLLWYGAGIPKGESFSHQHITDIAPTLAFLLDIKLPNGATGTPIGEVLR